MKFYLDTSFLVSCIAPERSSELSMRWLEASGQGLWAISDWVKTEVSSALATKVRVGILDEKARKISANFFANVLLPKLNCLEVTRADFDLSQSFFEVSGHVLRSGDALHIAISSRHGLSLVSYDRRMNEAADLLGVSRVSV